MYAKLFTLAASLALVSAVDFSHWSPPGPGDVRAPCPGLNSMANHGILPHDGKALSVPMLQQAMAETYNIGLDLSTVIAIGGLLTSSNPLGLTFDLDDLDEHNVIEHDASLSRADYNEGGDDHTFQQSIFNGLLAFYGSNATTDPGTAGRAHYARVQAESQSDGDFTYGPLQFVLANGESALYLSGMGDPVSGKVPVEYVKTFFEEERLPYDEGWRVPTTQVNGLTIAALVTQMLAESGEAIPEGLILTNTTFARAMLGLDMLGGEVPLLVQTLLDQFGMGDLL